MFPNSGQPSGPSGRRRQEESWLEVSQKTMAVMMKIAKQKDKAKLRQAMVVNEY